MTCIIANNIDSVNWAALAEEFNYRFPNKQNKNNLPLANEELIRRRYATLVLASRLTASAGGLSGSLAQHAGSVEDVSAAGVSESLAQHASSVKASIPWSLDEHEMLFECKVIHQNDYESIAVVLNHLFQNDRTPALCRSHFDAYSEVTKSSPGELPAYGPLPSHDVSIVDRTKDVESVNIASVRSSPIADESYSTQVSKMDRAWTPEEDALLEKTLATQPQLTWAQISTLFPGCTGTACKQRHYSLLKDARDSGNQQVDSGRVEDN